MKKEKTVVIMGLGLHGGGAGAANYFIEKGYRVTITDLKTKEELEESIGLLLPSDRVRFVLGRHEYDDFRTPDLVVKNPAVPKDSPYISFAKKHGVPVDSDIGIFLELVKDRTRNIIGVTGTKGKSTTCALIHLLLKKKFKDPILCGNITVSVFDVLKRIENDSYLVMELSSFQLGDIGQKRYSPRVGVFTSFFEDHLNYYRNMTDYYEDKAVLYRWQSPGDVLVYGRDGELPGLVKPNRGVGVYTFGLDPDFSGEGTFIREGKIYFRKKDREIEIMPTEEIQLSGAHNLYNVLTAATVAVLEGISPVSIREAVSGFRGLEHRLEFVGEKNGVLFFNDSAATNPEAAVKAIQSFSSPVTLIAGGYDKGLSLEKMTESINSHVSHLVLLEGNGTARLLEEGLSQGYTLFDSLGKAVRYAYRITKPGGIVLFSPGFASFGMFKNEFHRGTEFKRIVKEIFTEE